MPQLQCVLLLSCVYGTDDLNYSNLHHERQHHWVVKPCYDFSHLLWSMYVHQITLRRLRRLSWTETELAIDANCKSSKAVKVFIFVLKMPERATQCSKDEGNCHIRGTLNTHFTLCCTSFHRVTFLNYIHVSSVAIYSSVFLALKSCKVFEVVEFLFSIGYWIYWSATEW